MPKAKRDEHGQIKFMPDLPYDDGTDDNAGQQAAATKGPTTEELLARIEALTSQVSGLQSTNTALMSQPQMHNAPPAPTLDLSNMPDPTLDPEAYARETIMRQQKFNESQRAVQEYNAQQQQVEQRRLNALWEQFQEAHPGYDNIEQIEFVTRKVVQRAADRGLDVNKYMYANSAGFMNDVVHEYDKIFGQPANDDDDDDNDVSGTIEAADDRSAGIFGGMESGGKPAQGGKDKPGDMFDDIKAFQKKTGFY